MGAEKDNQSFNHRAGRDQAGDSFIGDAGKGALHATDEVARFAHELGNLLDGSLRNLGLATRRLEEKSTASGQSGQEALDRLHVAGDSLRQMAGMLKRWMEAGGGDAMNVCWEEGSLLEVMGRAIRSIEPLAQDAGIRIDVVLPAALSQVEAGKLFPVFLNGLRNAVEAIGRDGWVRVRGKRVLDQIEITIEDDGAGVDERLPRDERGLAPAGMTTKRHGHGMGLDISRRMLESMGGWIRLMDGLKKGAVLKVVWKDDRPAPGKGYASSSQDAYEPTAWDDGMAGWA